MTNKYELNDNVNKDNNFFILASFTRSFDEFHNKNDRIHLISSLCLVNENQSSEVLEILKKEKEYFNEEIENSNNIFYIFAIYPKDWLKNLKHNFYNYGGNIIIINATLESLIYQLGLLNNDKQNDVLSNVFGQLNLKKRDFNSIAQQSLFIFVNEMWSNILLKLKMNNIDVSGGTSPKRHILHTVDLQLLEYLYIIYSDKNKIKNIIYNSYKDPILSSSIPINFYKKFLLNKEKIINLKIKDIDKIPFLIKNNTLIKDVIELFKESHNTYEEIIINNFKYCVDFLKLDIDNKFDEKLDNINKLKINLELSLSTEKYNLYNIENINNISTIEMSNKSKKKLKKERKEIIQNQSNDNYLNELKSKISNLKLEIDEIDKKIFNIKEEKKEFIFNCSEFTIIELINFHSKMINSNDKYKIIFKKYKNIQNINYTQKRYYTNYINLCKFNENKIFKIKSNNLGYFNSIRNFSLKVNNNNNINIKKNNFYIDSPIFIELQRIINNSEFNFESQIKIEKFLNNQGSLLLNNRINQTLDINYYKLNPKILDYLKLSINDLDKLINNYRDNFKKTKIKNNTEFVESSVILSLNNEEIISQLLGRLLRIISNNNLFNKNTNCTELAYDLGQSLVFIYYSNEYNYNININNINKEISLSQFVDLNFNKFKEFCTDSVLIQIGLKLLNFLEEVNLIHSELYVLDKNHKNHIYVCNKSILDNLGNYINLFNLSYKIPMIVKPKKYGRNKENGKEILGGFLLNDKEYFTPLIIKNSELKNQSTIEEENIVYELANHLGSVAYKINIALLDFLLEKGLEYNLFSDPNFKHPLEIKKDSKKKLTLMENKTLESFLSRKQLEMNILGLALIFKNVPEFFIPVRIDNRGRVYCMVDYLNYQGIELAKALLLFAKGEKVNKCDKESIDYLKIFGANCFGNGIDKKSYNDRVNWINENEDNILNFRNGILIKNAESKLLFIAFCIEYNNYYNSLFNNDNFYISNFPIQLDATCNGYQHLSLLTGDESLAGQLNLVSGDKNTVPNDFYNFVLLKLNDYLINKLNEFKFKFNYYSDNPSELSDIVLKKKIKIKSKSYLEDLDNTIKSYDRLIKLHKNRKLVKLPIMVKPYNATLFQMVNYIKEQFEYVNINDNNFNTEDNKLIYVSKFNENIKLSYFDLFLLTSNIEVIVYNEFPKLKEFNIYLKKVAEICSKLNITITWTVPSGLNVNQYYVDSEAIRLKPFKFKKNTFSLKIKTDKINKSKQIRALMPNLIHSLDAASLALIVDMIFLDINNNYKEFNFFAIHDCFAVTCNNVVNLIKILKLVYIKIYSDDIYLKKFDQGIINSIKLHFGNDAFDDYNKIIKVNDKLINYPNVDEIIQGKIKAEKIMNAQSIIN